ncbi:MAG: helix-turn-helix transcriptional regulator [Rhodospirillales bacterium]|nr:helix-turn-helix transcriptional regulator [Rhodospirillales bacterium]
MQKKSPPARTRKPRAPKADDALIGTPRAVDIHVGQRLRLRRTLLGISQEKLGAAVNLTFQQIQKYERGANRVSASRLFEFSQVLDVSISYFFDDMNAKTIATRGRRMIPKPGEASEPESDPLARRETLELVRAYYKIIDPKVRKGLFNLTKNIAKGMAK